MTKAYGHANGERIIADYLHHADSSDHADEEPQARAFVPDGIVINDSRGEDETEHAVERRLAKISYGRVGRDFNVKQKGRSAGASYTKVHTTLLLLS